MQIDGPTMTGRGTNLVAGRRVKISAANSSWTQGPTFVYADDAELVDIGTLLNGVTGEGPVTVQLRRDPVQIEAASAITIGAEVFAAANGRVAATGTLKTHLALEAAAAAGNMIYAIPIR